MPAAAVIPAPIAYINAAAVKTLVVEGVWLWWLGGESCLVLRLGLGRPGYFEEIRVFKAGVLSLNTLAWNNGGLCAISWFVGWRED